MDDFFATTLPALARPDTLMIYTSDHGQALFEGGYDIQQCSNSAEQSKGEVTVPIFVWAGSGAFAQRLREHARLGFNQATHFEVFPTLLSAMGFPQRWVRREYGPSLLDFPLSREPRLLVGGIFDVGAYWIKLDRTGASSTSTTLVNQADGTPPKPFSRGSEEALRPRALLPYGSFGAAVAAPPHQVGNAAESTRGRGNAALCRVSFTSIAWVEVGGRRCSPGLET